MSAQSNKIKITLEIPSEDIIFQCSYLRHEEAISKSYKTTAKVEIGKTFNYINDPFKKVKQGVAEHNPVPVKITIQYYNEHGSPSQSKIITLHGNIVTIDYNISPASVNTVFTFTIAHEMHPLSLKQQKGALYKVYLNEALDKRLEENSKNLNLTEYTQFIYKCQFDNKERYPMHDCLVQYNVSDYEFIDKLLFTHGVWYQLYSHKDGVDFLISDSDDGFDYPGKKLKGKFYYDDDVNLSFRFKDASDCIYNVTRIVEGRGNIVDLDAEHKLRFSGNWDFMSLKSKTSSTDFDKIWSKKITVHHFNELMPERPFSSEETIHDSNKPASNNCYIGDDYFVNIAPEQLDIVVKTQAEQIKTRRAAGMVASFHGYIIRSGTFINVDVSVEEQLRLKTRLAYRGSAATEKHQLITQVIYEYQVTDHYSDQIQLSNIGKEQGQAQYMQYEENHIFASYSPACDYRTNFDFKRYLNAQPVAGVFPYQENSQNFSVRPDYNGRIPIIFPYDYNYFIRRHGLYTRRIQHANSATLNQSHPIYPDTELLLNFDNANPERPFIDSVLLTDETGHINSDERSHRQIHALPQGQMLAHTLEGGSNNAATYFSSHSDHNDQSFIHLSNMPSKRGTAEGDSHLDLFEGTTANKQINVQREYLSQFGIGAQKRPNVEHFVDPANPTKERTPDMWLPPATEVAESKTSAIQLVQKKNQKPKMTLLRLV